MLIYFMAFLCVLGMASGQILFKQAANELSQANVYINYKALQYFLSAVVLYGLTSIGWVLILKNIDLGRIYPFMALVFIIVPLGTYYLLGERFNPQYFVGVALIIIGIIIAVRS